MFSRFILITDLSADSIAAANYLEGLKKYGAKQCLLLLCLSFQETVSITLSRATGILEDTLLQLKEIIAMKGFKVEARIVPGFAAQEINWASTEENYSLIVVGSRKHSMVTEFFLKGAAKNVIRHFRKPLLLIRLEVNTEEGRKEVQAAHCSFTEHVLFPTDFSKSAEHAFKYVQKLVAGGVRRVTLLHVHDKVQMDSNPNPRLTGYNEIDWECLETMKKVLQEKGKADIGIEMCCGSPPAIIIRFTRERCVDLVVMGSRSRGLAKGLFLGSVGNNVVLHSETSVLLIPAKER